MPSFFYFCGMNIEIKPVACRRELRCFVRFPDILFKDNPHYIPALHADERYTLTPGRNPAFRYCDAKLWLAYRDGVVVGRVCAIVNHRANELWNEACVRFGFFDFVEDFEVCQALMEQVVAFGRSHGLHKIQGPMGFTNMDRECWMTEGFDQRQNMSTIYNPPYYVEFVRRLGFSVECEWQQFRIPVSQAVPNKVSRVAKVVQEKYNLRVLSVKRRKDIVPYAKKFFQTLNLSYKDIFGFIPLSQEEIDIQVNKYFSFVNLDLVNFIVDEHDDVVGFGLGLPDLSLALQKAKGSLFPLGWLRVLHALKHYDKVDLLLTGVRPDWQKRGVHALFHQQLHETALRLGIKEAYTNPQIANFEAVKVWENQYGMVQKTIRRAVFCRTI